MSRGQYLPVFLMPSAVLAANSRTPAVGLSAAPTNPRPSPRAKPATPPELAPLTGAETIPAKSRRSQVNEHGHDFIFTVPLSPIP